HLLNVVRWIAPPLEIVHVATDPLREGVDVRRRGEPTLAAGFRRLRGIDLEEQLQHEPDDTRYQRIGNRRRIGSTARMMSWEPRKRISSVAWSVIRPADAWIRLALTVSRDGIAKRAFRASSRAMSVREILGPVWLRGRI